MAISDSLNLNCGLANVKTNNFVINNTLTINVIEIVCRKDL